MYSLVSSKLVDRPNYAAVLIAIAFAASLILMLLGQYLLGPPNVHSARALVMAVEGGILVSWLLSGPQAHLFQSLKLFRWFVFFWMSVGFVGVFFASHSWASAFVGQMEWLAHLLTVVAVADYVRRGVVNLSSLFMGVILAATIILCFFVYRWLLLEDPRNYNWVWDAQPFLNIRHFPFLMLPAYVASLYFCTVKEGWGKSISFISSVVFLAAMFWGGGRGSIGAALIASIFVLIYNLYASKNIRILPLVYGVLLVVLAYWLSLLVATNSPAMGLRFGVMETAASADQISSGRLTIWRFVYAHMGPVQWLIGDGVDNYRFLPGRSDPTVHPHSWFFQSLSAWGLPVAIGLFFGTCFIIARLFWKLAHINKNSDKADIFFVAVFLVAVLILSVVDGNFYHSWAVYIAVPFFAYGLCILAGRSGEGRQPVVSDKQPGWVLYSSSFILVLTIIQLINVSTVFGSKVPSPDDWKSSLVMVLPYNTLTVENWLEPWQRQSPEDAFHLLRWLQENSPTGYRFMLIEAEILAGAGRGEAALKKYEQAVNSAPRLTKAKIIESGPPVVLED